MLFFWLWIWELWIYKKHSICTCAWQNALYKIFKKQIDSQVNLSYLFSKVNVSWIPSNMRHALCSVFPHFNCKKKITTCDCFFVPILFLIQPRCKLFYGTYYEKLTNKKTSNFCFFSQIFWNQSTERKYILLDVTECQ